MRAAALPESPAEKTDHPHVIRTEGVCGGRPHLAGSRVSVRTIAELFRRGETAEEMVASYPHLEPAAIYDGISYYLDHREELEAELAAANLDSLLAESDAELGADGVVRFARTG